MNATEWMLHSPRIRQRPPVSEWKVGYAWIHRVGERSGHYDIWDKDRKAVRDPRDKNCGEKHNSASENH